MTGGGRDDGEDDDSTRFVPMPPNRPAPPSRPADDEDDDRTAFQPMPHAEDDDRTAFQPMPGGPTDAQDRGRQGDQDEDRTAFAPMPPDGGPPSQTAAPAPPSQTAAPAPPTSRRPQAPQQPGTTAGSRGPAGHAAGPGSLSGSMHPGHPPRTASHDPRATAPHRADTTPPPSQPPAGPSGPRAAPAPPPPPGPRPGARAEKLTVGTIINNNYRVDQDLNSGGMGEIYRGSEIHTGDPVAIKAILRDRAGDENAAQLFKREARTLRQLRDETIVTYYNYVHDRELDRFFLVMEYIEGVQLKDHVARNGPLSLDEVNTLLPRLAGGLAKAHAQGTFHRDLSPDNVMLPGGSVRDARIIDFGIAKSSVMTDDTMAGMFAGKLKYVAPEQFGHFDGRITQATDIYGLALLIAAAANGKPLHMGDSMAEAIQLRKAIPDLSTLPKELRPLLSYMLEPDPADRPASMSEVQRLVAHPEDIPDRYFDDWIPPAKLAARTATTAAGIQAPHMMPGVSATGSLPGATTQSPIPIDDDADGGGGSGRWLAALAVLFVVIVAGAVTVTGLDFGGGAGGDDADTGATAGIPPPDTGLREGFLASVDTGPCTLLSRVAAGPLAGVVEGYSRTGTDFPGVPPDYERRFGARPVIEPRQISDGQCPVLDFVGALQGRGRPGAVELGLSSARMQSEERIVGTLELPADRSLWVILVNEGGAWADLTSLVSQPVGDERRMGFALRAQSGSDPAPQLVLAVESDTPLAEVAVDRDGSDVRPVLDAVLDEIRARGGEASADLAYFTLTPN